MTDAPGDIRVAGRLSFPDGPVEVDFALRPGGWTCLLGPSGVGKSTILRLLAGLEVGVAFDGEIRTQPCAYMAQSGLLAPWLDIAGNVGLGARLRGEPSDPAAVARMIDRVGLSAHARRKPPQLSGGMQQRVALARTLMEDRPLALLDEPFSALDARTRAEMQEMAFETLKGRTVLIVTHDPGEAARLGEAIWLMTEAGLTQMPAIDATPIRPADAPETLSAQAELLKALRA